MVIENDSDSDPVYTVAICHLNMKETVAKSIESIIDQIDDRFEVLVIDDGSDDGSLDILKRLVEKHDALRLISLEFDRTRNLGETRNISFQESNGEYILEQLDADNRYYPGILDFVNIYHQIEDHVNSRFYLKGKSINVAPRELLLDIPYRNFKRAQDRDLWRRLFADDKMIWLEHEPFFDIMRDPYSPTEQLINFYNLRVSDFRSGVSYRSYVRWCLSAPRTRSIIWRLFIGTVAVAASYKRGRRKISKEYRTMGTIKQKIQNESRTLKEIEEEMDLEINRDDLSEFGERVFFRYPEW